MPDNNQDDNNSTNLTLDQTIDEPDVHITNQQGTDISGNIVTNTTFTTTDTNDEVQINENLTNVVVSYYDDDSSGNNFNLINQIKSCADQLQCSDFHGKGTIDDYSVLFTAASKIATDTKQMTLDIDTEGFNEFAQAADDLSLLFNSFIVKLQNVSIINDTEFLTAVLNSLQSIVKLTKVFGKFKETILATTSLELPKSAHDTKVILEGVSCQLNCAMKYISYFADSTSEKPSDCDLTSEDQNIITRAVDTIDNWNKLCDQGVSISLSNNQDIQYIKQINTDLKSKTRILTNATNTLKNKFKLYNIIR